MADQPNVTSEVNYQMNNSFPNRFNNFVMFIIKYKKAIIFALIILTGVVCQALGYDVPKWFYDVAGSVSSGMANVYKTAFAL